VLASKAEILANIFLQTFDIRHKISPKKFNGEQSRPIIPNSRDLVGCGFPIMMSSTDARMELVHDFHRLLFV